MTSVGPYDIASELGRGGMGVVYRARRQGAGHDVALKVIGDVDRPGTGPSPEALARFQREARIAQELDHPGIVKVLDSGMEGEAAWFAMELVEGEPLSQCILEREFTWQAAVGLVRDVADALAVAHARGVLHRDIKPGNIILDSEDKPHLTDFGLAKDLRTGSKYTRTGQTLGTPAYMPPEQARGDLADLSPSSDVWALGCVLYEAIAGRTAFEGATPAVVVGQVLTATPTPIRVLIPGVPADVSEFVQACLTRDPAGRPRDAAAVRDDCRRLLEGQRPQSRVAPSGRAVPVLGAVGVLVLAGIAGTVWFASRPSNPGAAAGHGPPAAPSAAQAEAERLAPRAWAARNDDLERATRDLERAVELDGARFDWQVRLGLLQWALGRGAEARALWAHIPENSEHWAAARLYRGLESCYRLREWTFQVSAGIEDLRLAALGSGKAAELARIAVAVIEDRNWAVARADLAGRPGWIAALLRAQVESSAPDGDRALVVREYDTALAEGIRFPWLFYQRGAQRAELGDLPGAVQDYDRALQRWPEYQMAVTNRGVLHSRLGHDAQAIADLVRGAELDPTDHMAWEWLGITQLRVGNAQAAVEALHEAVRTEPECDIALRMRADAWAQSGDLVRAEADVTAVLHRSPRNVDALKTRINVRHATGNWRGKLEDLDAALALEPDSLQMREARGILRLERGLGAMAAAADFEVCVAARPESAPDLFNLGLAYLFADDAARALPRFEKAADLHRRYLAANPGAEDVPAVKRWLADCERRAAGARLKLGREGR